MATGKRKTTAEFIIEATNIHNLKYGYSLVNYINKKIKIKIVCPKHGVFEQQPDNHLMGQGCKSCNHDRKFKSPDNFISDAKNLYGDKYDYSLVEYINNQTPVTIICSEHGEYSKTPNSHLCGQGCPTCSLEIRSANTTKTHDKFLIEANAIHNNLYQYLSEYVKSYEKVTIKCNKCNHTFKQTPRAHLEGKGCSVCKNSMGESKIRQILLESKIEFEQEFVFDECRNIHHLPFDFYIQNLNTCIEYDGRQHYQPIEFFGGEKGLVETQKRDAIKTKYCLENDIKLIRIRYDEDIIEKIKPIL